MKNGIDCYMNVKPVLTIYVWIEVLRYSIYCTRISCFQAEIYNSFARTGNNLLLLREIEYSRIIKYLYRSIRATSTALHGLGRSSIKSIFCVDEIATECIIVLVIYRRATKRSCSLHPYSRYRFRYAGVSGRRRWFVYATGKFATLGSFYCSLVLRPTVR